MTNLQKVQEQDFDIYKFSAYFAEKYGVEQNIALEDIKLVIQSLQYKEEGEQAGEKNISLENTYAYVYDCYDKQDKIFKVFFELTYACNLKCEHCYLSTDINSSKTKITLKKAKEVIDQLRELGVV